MAAPDLVFNEPVATGWVRTELYGAVEAGSARMYAARTLLGNLRAMYGVNERIAAGESGGFYRQEILLEDGTTIEAITNDGHDTLRIRVPPPPTPHPQPKSGIDITPYPTFIICGTCKGADGTNRAVLWESDVSPPRNLGVLDGYTNSYANAISEDGEVVVGYCDNGVNTQSSGFRWTHSTGMVDIGHLNPSLPYSKATDVNRDGSVIVGIDHTATTLYSMVGFVWRQDATPQMSELPQPSVNPEGMTQYQKVCVSPSGQYIAGALFIPTVVGQNQDGAWWVNDSPKRAVRGPFRLPLPGTIGKNADPGNHSVSDQRNYSRPTNVTDTGLVSGDVGNVAWEPYYTTQTFWDTGYGVPGGFTSGVEGARGTLYQQQVPSKNACFSYQAAGPTAGDYRLVNGPTGQSVSAADDVSAAIGNTQTADKANFEYPQPDQYGRSLVRTYGEHTNIHSHGWVLTKNGLTDLGPDTFVYDVAEDGLMVVGCFFSGDANGPNIRLPARWSLDARMTLLPLLEGSGYGYATGIASIEQAGEIVTPRMTSTE